MHLRTCLALLLAMGVVGLAFRARADIEPQPTTPKEEPKPAPVMTKPPAVISSAAPVYPDQARADHRAGDVLLLVTIDATGAVADVAVKQSSGSTDLDDAALAAARQYVFSPAEIDGKPAAVSVELRIGFTLDDQKLEVPADVPPAPGEAPAPAPPSPPSAPAAPATAPQASQAEATGPVVVAGLVRAAVTKLALPDVEVSVEGSDHVETSDGEGRFQLRGLAPGKYRLDFAVSGYQPSFVDIEVVEKQRTDVVVVLDARDGNTFETVVRQKRSEAEVTRVALTREETKTVPGTFGDPLRVIENLPGLARASFGGGQLIVRGANPEDSSVLFDGIPIPNLYHFQGLKSVVNAEFLENIDFYPGGFPAKYGRATAGVVDVESRKLVPDALRGSFDVNLMDAGFFLTVPLDVVGLPNTTIAAAARRSYIDTYLPTVLQIAAGPSGQAISAVPVYWDYQAKLQHKLSDGELSLFAFGADDAIKVESTGLGNNAGLSLDTDTSFHRVAARWTWRPQEGVNNTLQPFFGVTSSNTSAGSTVGVASDTYNWGVRDELRVAPLDGVHLVAGVDYLGESNDLSASIPLTLDVNGFPRVVPRTGTSSDFSIGVTKHGVGAYTQAEVELFPHFLAVPGLRADFDRVSFAPHVNDDGTSTKGEDIDFVHVDPRVALRWEILPKLTVLKASAGLYHETPTTQELSPQGGNASLQEPGAAQYIVGVEQQLYEGLSVDVEGYITDRFDLVEGALGGGGFGAPGGGGGGGGPGGGGAATATTTSDNNGTGHTYGLELLLRQELTKDFYGWVAYTLSRTTVDTNANSTTQLLSQFDQTHILTIVAQGKLPWGFSLGGRFRYVTGNPTSLPAGSTHDLDTGNYTLIRASDAETREPDFFQLDVRLDKKFTFDSLALTTYVDVLNATNNANAEAVVSDFRGLKTQVITGLPILPVVGVSGEF